MISTKFTLKLILWVLLIIEKLKNSKIQKKGTCTRFDTESQINNYITELKNYKDLLSYIKNKIEVK